MEDVRWNELMWGLGYGRLTEEEIAAGWHWCPDWDDLLIGPDPKWDGERELCHCFDSPSEVEAD